MSLGLESTGYELSPMAGETFAYNILNETLKGNKSLKKTLWIKSQYSKNDIDKRLRESPFEAPKGKYSDINSNSVLKNKLLIGDINELLTFFENNPQFHYIALMEEEIIEFGLVN